MKEKGKKATSSSDFQADLVKSMKNKGRKESKSTSSSSNPHLELLFGEINSHISDCARISRYETEFEEIQELGMGSFGVVNLCRNHLDKGLYAVKLLFYDENKTDKEHMLKEVCILASLNHPSIVRYYSAWVEELEKDEELVLGHCLFIQMEYCPQTLETVITKGIEKGAAMQYFCQLVQGLDYLHKHDIIHRDLSPKNIFLDADNHIKIAIKSDRARFSSHAVGHWNYRAPETEQTSKADIFGVGIILFQLLNPAKSREDMVQLLGHLREGYFPVECEPGYKALIQKLVSKNPNNRPSPAEILQSLKILVCDADSVTKPTVLIDSDSCSDATILKLIFGDRHGALIDMMKALNDLGMDVTKGDVLTDGSVKQTTLFITQLDTGRKIEDPDMLKIIELTISDNLLKYHPKPSVQPAKREASGIKAPKKKVPAKKKEKRLDVDIGPRIKIEDGPERSLVYFKTAHRPGLHAEIFKIFAYVNIDVESVEINRQGSISENKFHVSYRGGALGKYSSQIIGPGGMSAFDSLKQIANAWEPLGL